MEKRVSFELLRGHLGHEFGFEFVHFHDFAWDELPVDCGNKVFAAVGLAERLY